MAIEVRKFDAPLGAEIIGVDCAGDPSGARIGASEEARWLNCGGLPAAGAHARLGEFGAGAQDRGRRCVLVSTGKGRVSEDGGVLRRMVPRWIDTPPSRGRVLSLEQAQPKHGGAGALYLLLRKRR